MATLFNFPSELVLKGEKLYQFPVEELKALRKDEIKIEDIALSEAKHLNYLKIILMN